MVAGQPATWVAVVYNAGALPGREIGVCVARERVGPRVEFRLWDAQVVAVKQFALESGISEAEVVRRLLQYSIDRCMQRRIKSRLATEGFERMGGHAS